METRPPSLLRVITMSLFALSCVGLLIFLWVSFGGTLPFAAKGYDVRVSFPYADQLGTQADVRIAGVSVGKVIGKSLDPQGNRTIATLELERRYAPIHRDARAILRTKTILGETYVELTPGTRNSPILPDDGLLPRGHVRPAVQLDQILGAFDPTTRHAFRQWQQQLAKVLQGNDQNLNSVLGNLPTFAADATDILRVLDVQHTAVVGLLQNGGTVFNALGRDQTSLRNLITSGEATFATTAANQAALADTFRQFPSFLSETKLTMARLQSFSLNTDPLVRRLQPVANDLGPTLHSVQVLSPDLRRLFYRLGPLITASRTGLPGVRDVINGATPLLGSLGPFLEQLNPILSWLSLHQQLISDFLSNGAAPLAAKTIAFGGASTGHYLRQFSPIGPETLSLAGTRDPNNRGNTYPPPLWLTNPKNLQTNTYGAFDCANTGAGGDGTVAAKGGPAPLGSPACWVAPTLPGAQPGQIPHVAAASYPRK